MCLLFAPIIETTDCQTKLLMLPLIAHYCNTTQNETFIIY